MPKVSSISKTMTARSRDSISRSVSFVSSVISFSGLRIFLRRIAIIFSATSSMAGSVGRFRAGKGKAPHSFNQSVANEIAANLPQVQQDPPKINTFVQREGEGKTQTVVE